MKNETSELTRHRLGRAAGASRGVSSAQLGTFILCLPPSARRRRLIQGRGCTGKDALPARSACSCDGTPDNLHILIDILGLDARAAPVLTAADPQFFDLTLERLREPAPGRVSPTSRGWDPNIQYLLLDLGTGLGADTASELFQDSKFYGYLYWAD